MAAPRHLASRPILGMQLLHVSMLDAILVFYANEKNAN